MGLNFKILVIWKALSTMSAKVTISAAGVMPGGFGSAGSKGSAAPAPAPAPAPASHCVHPSAVCVDTSMHPSVPAHVAPKLGPIQAACKYGDKCHGCSVCKKGGKGGGAQVAQLSSQVNDLKKELASMKAVSAATDARLGKVETDVGETKSGIAAMLAMMQEDRKQRELPPPPARPAIMPPPSTQRSQSPPPRMTLVTSGTEGSFGQECGHWVPKFGSSNSTSIFSGPYTGQNGWADKAVAGGGAMVVSKPTGTLPSPSSLSRKGALPSPSSLPDSGRNSAGMSGSGLVRCNDQDAFFQLLTAKGWNTMLTLLKGTNSSNHVLTAAVNAVALSLDDEANAVAITCFDRARSVSAFDPHLHGQMQNAFDPENPAFKQFCIRMADYCSKSPDKGIEYRRTKYPYAHLVQNDQHRKELIAALRDN
jgi:hypothetical protein